jgi:glycosyltransferase involved in cell wall biosynthesis
MKLDIIIPVYNEDKNIVHLLKKLEDEINCNFRILICYDNDNDTTLKYFKTGDIITKEILLVKNPSQGPNSAIIEGINSSNAEIVLIYMADDFENIKLINKMIDLVDGGNELILPSRFIPGGRMQGAKKIKKMITIIGSYLVYYLARIPFKDCTNAFKMFSKNLKDKIKLESTTGFTFALELTTKSYLSNFKIIEIPSIWIEAKDRKSNFKIYKWLPYYIYWLLYSIIKNLYKRKK